MVLYVFRYEIAAIFTDHEEIASIVVASLPVIGLLLAGDFLQAIATGTIRAMGYQSYATIF